MKKIYIYVYIYVVIKRTHISNINNFNKYCNTINVLKFHITNFNRFNRKKNGKF